jgi:hypothetical protein
MSDPTEAIRREMVATINAQPGSREALEAKHGQVWDTNELGEDFDVLGFAAPLVVVRRKSDGVRGSLYFQHNPLLLWFSARVRTGRGTPVDFPWESPSFDTEERTMKTIRVTVEGGVIQHIACPQGVRVVVRDYDVDGSEEDLNQDDNGDNYIEDIWEHSDAAV